MSRLAGYGVLLSVRPWRFRLRGGLYARQRRWLGPSFLLLVVCFLTLAACRFPGSVKPTVKVGLSAPFEGLHRDLGYEALYAVRLAVRQRNDAGGVGGRYLVELVALNDFDEPEEAIVQARKMAVDSGVLGVLGGWSPTTAGAAAAEYERLGLPYLSPQMEASTPSTLPTPDSEFAHEYQVLSGGVPPGPVAVWAYTAASYLLDTFDAVVRVDGRPTRSAVQAALRSRHR